MNGYFVNGQEPGSEKFAYKMRWLDGLQAYVRAEMAAHPQLVLLGDFNITPEDQDSYDPEGLRDTIHHTREEREHFRQLLALGLTDSFRMFEQLPKSYSWWDYRMLGYQKNRGLRIDHILVSEALKPQVKGCTIDRVPRKWEKPSDHAPVTVELGVAGLSFFQGAPNFGRPARIPARRAAGAETPARPAYSRTKNPWA